MKELKSKHFENRHDLVKWVNDHSKECTNRPGYLEYHEIISICNAGRFSDGFILFYR
jgi:hypothetical protein